MPTYTKPITESAMTLCPKANCGQPMQLDPHLGYDAGTGLQCIRCHGCGHCGMRAQDGLHLLFTAQHEYVFSYGPSPSYLKIVLSTVALNLFSIQGLSPVQLATYVAEWALVMGQVCGTVRLAGNLVLSDCYDYFQRRALTGSGILRLSSR